MNKLTDWVIVGRFGRTHGIKGNVVVNSFTEPHDNITRYREVFCYLDHQWQPIKWLNIEVKNKNIIAQVKGFETTELAAALTNADIAIAREDLANLPDGEYYWHELIGMTVTNLQGIQLGKISAILPTGSNDVLVIEGEKRHLVPYLLNQFVMQIDREQQQMTVDWDVDF